MSFKFTIKKIKEIKKASLIYHSKYIDHRGTISSIFSRSLQKKIIGKQFNNYIDKIVYRKKNVLTGIHGDKKTWKILSCVSGKILLIIVDCNPSSKNFGNYFKTLLDGKSNKTVVIPPKIGNSFLCLSNSIIHYKNLFNGDYIDHNKQFTFKWNDKKLKLPWPIKKPILSRRDL